MKEQLDDLKIIREIMEKSSKFISLSGLSGIIAGVTAIAGASFAYFYLLRNPAATNFNSYQETLILLFDAFLVLAISIGCALYLSGKKAKKLNQKLFNKVTQRTLYNLGIPLITGGILALILIKRGDTEMAVAITLIFYGLALINASKFTYNEVHYLGITQIILGIAAAIFLNQGLFFWTLGFGICHIIYGAIMYKKYDTVKA